MRARGRGKKLVLPSTPLRLARAHRSRRAACNELARSMFRPTGGDEAPEEAAAFQAALAQSDAQRRAAKADALEACAAEQLALLQCYRQGSFAACAAPRQAFWACYKAKRVLAPAHPASVHGVAAD